MLPVMESDIEYEGFDEKEASRLVANNFSKEEIQKLGMASFIPERKSVQGVRPGNTTSELSKRRRFNKEGEEVIRISKWVDKKARFSKPESRAILGKVVETAVRCCMKNHAYKFHGRMYISINAVRYHTIQHIFWSML